MAQGNQRKCKVLNCRAFSIASRLFLRNFRVKLINFLALKLPPFFLKKTVREKRPSYIAFTRVPLKNYLKLLKKIEENKIESEPAL